jgi:hypothetical protein
MIALAICLSKIWGSVGEAAHGNLRLTSTTPIPQIASKNSDFSKDKKSGETTGNPTP